MVFKGIVWCSVLSWCLVLLDGNAQAGIYRWVDANGIVHYADFLPAGVNPDARLIPTAHGLLFDAAALSDPAELAEQQRRATALKLREASENQKQTQDKHLLANYRDVAELDGVFQSKVKVLEESNRLLAERRSALAQRLAELGKQAEKLREARQRAELFAYLADAKVTLAAYDNALHENEAELEQLRQRHAKERERLQQLLSASPSSQRLDLSVIPAALHGERGHQ